MWLNVLTPQMCFSNLSAQDCGKSSVISSDSDKIPLSCSTEPPIHKHTHHSVKSYHVLWSALVQHVKNRQLLLFSPHRQTYIFEESIFKWILFHQNLRLPAEWSQTVQLVWKDHMFSQGFTLSPLPISDGIIHWLHRVKAPWPAPP